MRVLAVVILCLVSISAWAQFADTENGSKMHWAWTSYQKDTAHPGYEIGYFMGVVSGVVSLGTGWFDIPEGVSFTQVCAVVGKYVEAHPEMWGESAGYVAVRALRGKWPIVK